MNGRNGNAYKTAFFLGAMVVTIFGLCLGFQEINRLRENYPDVLQYGIRYMWNSGWWRVTCVPLTLTVFIISFILSFVKDEDAAAIILLSAWTLFTGVVGFFMWMGGKMFYLF